MSAIVQYRKETDAERLMAADVLSKDGPRKDYRLLTVSDIVGRRPAPNLVKGLLPRHGVVAIYGPSGSGKSFLTLDLIGAIGRGDPWFGHRTQRAPIIYICLEGSHGLANRVEAYTTEIGSLPGLNIIIEPYRLVDLNDEAALLNSIKKAHIEGAVIIIDTLAQATAGLDENNGNDMTRAIAACQRVQAETDGLVILIHHTGKDSNRGLRGHSSLIGALDAAIEVSGGKDVPRKWVSAKVKDGESGNEYPFALRRVVLGEDEDGDEISSCVIEVSDHAADVVGRAKVPAGGNQRIIWDGLGELLRKATDYHGSAPPECPPGRPAILIEVAIEELRDRLTCDIKRKTERTRQALTGLINSGLIVSRGGWIWCS